MNIKPTTSSTYSPQANAASSQPTKPSYRDMLLTKNSPTTSQAPPRVLSQDIIYYEFLMRGSTPPPSTSNPETSWVSTSLSIVKIVADCLCPKLKKD